MKTTLRSLLSLLFFFAVLPVVFGTAPDALTAGKFLVLRNGHTLEGDIRRIDDRYRVVRNGAETWIPERMVLRLFPDADAAYRFLLSKTPPDDADARLSLASWCLEVNLRDQAAHEAQEADRLRPKDPEIKRFLAHLQQSLVTTVPAPTSPVPPPKGSSLPPPDLTPESLGQFTKKVQPLLLNACASCHAGERSGSFKLLRTVEVPALDRKVTQENLLAVLGQINAAQPQVSPLLVKAITLHGGGEQAPLRGRQSIPYLLLEEWITTTLATNPQLQERLGQAPIPPPPAPAKVLETKALFAATEPKVEMHPLVPPRPNVVPIAPALSAPPAPRSVPSTATAKPPENRDDDFDPAEFNRQAHPERDPPLTPRP